MRSIERTLLGWILGALSLGLVLAAALAYVVTLEELNDIFDADLKNIAEAVAAVQPLAQPASAAAAAGAAHHGTPDEDEIVTQIWSTQGERLFVSDPRVPLPFSAVAGLSQPRLQGQDWIVHTTLRGGTVVQAAQRAAARREVALDSAVQVFAPMFGLVILVGGLLIFGLRRGLRPLDAATHDVAARSIRSLEPIPVQGVPAEIAPLVASINDLLGRLAAAFAAQRQFLADAAHELRTPMTALRLQLQLLERASDDHTRHVALAELELGIERSQRLVEQMLHVARAQPDGELLRLEQVDLAALVRSVVAGASLRAEQSGIDLGAQAPAEALVMMADRHQLTVLLGNLVDNALRYTAAGGVVDVRAGWHEGRPLLCVVDNGPGIEPDERERVFDRFYRGRDAALLARDTSGSGLGLAIVRAIAEHHAAVVSLHTAPGGRGLEVRVVFPAPTQASAVR